MAGISRLHDFAISGVDSAFDDDADATIVNNFAGGPCVLPSIFVDNAAYATKIYLKLWDAGTAVVGTDDPHYQFPIAANTSELITCIADGEESGFVFTVGMCYAVTIDAGTAGSTPPVTPPDIWFVGLRRTS